MRNNKKGPIRIGGLYTFEAWLGKVFYLVPAEIATAGRNEGFVVTYAFRPAANLEVAASRTRADLLLDPFFANPLDFSRSAFVDAGANLVLAVPFFERHVFYEKYGDQFHDTNGVTVFGQLDYRWSPSIVSPGSLAHRLSTAMGLSSLETEINAAEDRRSARDVRVLADADSNSRSAILTIVLGEEEISKTGIAIGDISATVERVLRPGKLGSCDGESIGEGVVEIFCNIKPRRYPEAVQDIRACMSRLGIEAFKIYGIQVR